MYYTEIVDNSKKKKNNTSLRFSKFLTYIIFMFFLVPFILIIICTYCRETCYHDKFTPCTGSNIITILIFPYFDKLNTIVLFYY